MPADAVGSRHELDYERGLERMERAGAVVSTVEAVAVRAARARRHAGVQGRPEADPLRWPARPAYVLLEDGTRFDGEACGAEGHAVGEVVFTTGMSGYQESMTDPSFAGQLIAFTYPHIGNYGASAQAMESERAWARAAIMREACNREDAPSAERGWLDWLSDCGVPAISGVDTRALVHAHPRRRARCAAACSRRAIAEAQARELIDAEPPMAGQDLAARGHARARSAATAAATGRASP